MLVSFSVLRGSCIRCGGILLSDGEEEEKAPFSYHDPDIAFERCVSGSASNSFGTLTLQWASNLFAKFPLEFFKKKLQCESGSGG